MFGGLTSPVFPRRPPPGVYCLDVVGCMVTECAGALADGDDVAPDASELLRIALGGLAKFTGALADGDGVAPDATELLRIVLGGIVELVDGVSSALSL